MLAGLRRESSGRFLGWPGWSVPPVGCKVAGLGDGPQGAANHFRLWREFCFEMLFIDQKAQYLGLFGVVGDDARLGFSFQPYSCA